MLDALLVALTLLGSLGVIIFGLRLLSASLQRLTAPRIGALVPIMGERRARGILAGLLATGAVQSSSATAVMVVSFGGTGMLSLAQSVGVIMGVNIGGTITPWVIALVGFELQLGRVLLPLVGLGLPLLLSQRPRLRALGELAVGFALLFVGLDFLRASWPGMEGLPALAAYLSEFWPDGVIGRLLLFALGGVMAFALQSSSIALALTLVMSLKGWIGFDQAAAVALGANLGAALTVCFAAAKANAPARRVAMAHLIFNLFGVAWLLIAFQPFARAIGGLSVALGGVSPWQAPMGVPVALCLFHSAFNLANTLVLVWFVPLMVRLVTRLVPARGADQEMRRLGHIGLGLLSTAELSMPQAHREMLIYAKRTYRMFGLVKALFEETHAERSQALFARIEKYEAISDRMEVEIAAFLSRLASCGLSGGSMVRLQAMLQINGEIESLCDHNYQLARILERKRQAGAWFNQGARDGLSAMLKLVDDGLAIMIGNLRAGPGGIDLGPARQVEAQVNQLRSALRDRHLQEVEGSGQIHPAAALCNDLHTELERLADRMLSVSVRMARAGGR